MSKTHYRKVYKSDHLGTPDLEDFIEEGCDLVFTISDVKQYFGSDKISVAGRKINANIVHFKEGIKPWVVNATNGNVLKKLAQSPFIEDWKGLRIELYIDRTVKMKGEVVGGVRVKDVPPKPISEMDLEQLKLKLIAIANVEQLTKLYNSDVKYKTNKQALEMIKKRKQELTNDGTN
jgi:hypothetical protein